MTIRSASRLGLAGLAWLTLVVVLTLGAVRQVRAVDDATKNEVERLAAELRKAQEANAALLAENKTLHDKLRNELEKRVEASPEQHLQDAKRQYSKDLIRVQEKKIEEAKTATKTEPPPVPDGPSPDQLKRLTEELRRRAEAERDQTEQARREAEVARARAEEARQLAEERERAARAAEATRVDPARLDAEIRAARFEAQLHVMQMAYNDLRKEANRLREELDAERKARFEERANRGAADPRTQQRLDHLEAIVTKLSMVVDDLTQKLGALRREK